MEQTILSTKVHRATHRYLSLCYHFQELRLECARSWADLGVTCRRLNPACPFVHVPELPIYSFIETATGAFHIVQRLPVAGGATESFLHCWTEAVPEATVLHVEGEIDLASAPRLANAIAKTFDDSLRVIIDLSRVDYLNGSGIHILENAASSYGTRFVVVGSKPEIHRLFDILELNDALRVVVSVEAAREYLRRQ